MKICGDSSTVELPLFQGEDGGSSPTSPLSLNLSGWKVEDVSEGTSRRLLKNGIILNQLGDAQQAIVIG